MGTRGKMEVEESAKKERRVIISVLDSYGIIKKAGMIADEIISDLSELRKPSEPETNVGEAGKGYEKIYIAKGIKESVFPAYSIECMDTIEYIRSDIAALMQPDKELLDALKIAQTLLSENLPLIRDFRNNQLRELWDSPTFTNEAYQAKAADIHNENKYAYDILVKINEAISNYEKLHK